MRKSLESQVIVYHDETKCTGKDNQRLMEYEVKVFLSCNHFVWRLK